MKLNTDFYKKEIYGIWNKDEEFIVKAINEMKEEEYEKVLYVNKSPYVIQALSDIRKNIINWYPITEQSTVLEIGANFGEITGELCSKAKKVVAIEASMKKAELIAKRHKNKENLEIIVGNLKDINLDEKFDYITLIGTFEEAANLFKTKNPYKSLIEYAKKNLKEDGKILIATNNPLAMMYFSGINRKNDNLLGIEELKELFEREGMEYKFYYPLPDYKLTNAVFTEGFLPNDNLIDTRALTYFNVNEEFVNFSEREKLKEILHQNKQLFKYFTNSYFIELSEYLEENEIKAAIFENNRKPEYRLKIVIQGDKVFKTAINEKSKEHVKNIKKNIDILLDKNFNSLDGYMGDTIISLYQENTISLNDYIINIYKQDGLNAAIDIMKMFKETVLDKFELGDSKKSIFDYYGISYTANDIEGLTFLKEGMWDLLYQNCFYINNQFYIYDQEWNTPNTPKEFIIYRQIRSLKDLDSSIEQEKLYEIFNITRYISLFKQLEYRIDEQVKDDTIWELHRQSVGSIKTPKQRAEEINSIKMGKEEELNQARIYSKSLELLVKNKENHILNLEKIIELKEAQLAQITNSKSWKLTKPLRRLSEIFNKSK